MEAREETAPKAERRESFYQRSTNWQLPTFVVSLILAGAFIGFQWHANRVEREALRPSFELAEILRSIDEGHYSEALARLEMFFSLYPHSNLVAEAHLRKADVLARMVEADGDYGARASDFEEALVSAGVAGAPPEATLKQRLDMARALASHQKYPEALKECETGLREVVEAESLRDEVKEWMLELLVDYGDIAPEAALAEVGKRMFEATTSVETAELELVRGHILRRDGQFEEAEAAYGRVVELLPDSLAAAAAFYWQGMALFGKEEYPDAYAKFVYAGKRLGDVPPVEKASFYAGETLFRMGNYELALREFESCAYRFSGAEIGKAAMLRVGDTSLRLERFGEASAAYYRALEASPPQELAINPWVDVEKSLDELSKVAEKTFAAGDYLTSYNLLKPLSAFGRPREKFLYQSGLALLGMGRKAGDPGEKRNLYLSAASVMEQIGEDYPASEYLADALWNGAEALFEAGEYAAATDTYRRFSEGSWEDPRTSEAIYKRGLCYQRLGLYDAAIEVFGVNEVSFPNVIHAYHSRYEKGCSYMAKGEAIAAEGVFLGIIHDPRFSPGSRVWRDALFSLGEAYCCLLYTSPSPRDATLSRMPSSA